MHAATQLTKVGLGFLATLVLAVSSAGPLSAQSQPELSGRWVLESQTGAAADVPRAISVRQSLVRTMERGPMKPFVRDLTIEREFESGTRVESYQIGAAGVSIPSLTKDSNVSGVPIDASVHWEGRSLVIETTAAEPASTGERREVWATNPDGDLTLTVSRRFRADPATTESYIYRRQ
jgi:hypothetical protein